MGLGGAAAITAALQEGGLAPKTPAAVIASATLPGERVVVTDLGHLAERIVAEDIRPPALLVIGGIVGLRAALLGEAP